MTAKLGKWRSSERRELLFVTGARGFFGRRRAAVSLAANFQSGRTRLAEALHSQLQHTVLHLGVKHAAHRIALGRPEMQQTFVVIPGDRVLGLAKIEGDGAIFEHDRSGGFTQKILHGAGEGVGSHERIVYIRRGRVCDE